jgi:hypothetical protein
MPATKEKTMMPKQPDDARVMWVAGGQHIASTVRVVRKALRASHPDWTDDQIEGDLFARIASEASA